MRTTTIAISLCVLGNVILHAPARADEYRGTMDQQMACTPDVWRLCSDQIPDVNRIVACLRQNTPQLSDGCRAVFETSSNGHRPPRVSRPLPPPPQGDEWFR